MAMAARFCFWEAREAFWKCRVMTKIKGMTIKIMKPKPMLRVKTTKRRPISWKRSAIIPTTPSL